MRKSARDGGDEPPKKKPKSKAAKPEPKKEPKEKASEGCEAPAEESPQLEPPPSSDLAKKLFEEWQVQDLWA